VSTPAISIADIEKLLGHELGGDSRAFTHLSGYTDADPESIVFAQDQVALAKALESDAGLILAPLHTVVEDARIFAVKHPKHAFALCGRWFDNFRTGEIADSAVVDGDASVGFGTSIGACCVVEKGAVLGEGCLLASNVTIYGCVTLGDRVVVQAGAVLGAMGFGYVRGDDGTYIRFPQQGTLVIEDDVEIGANTTIDRGALG
jgi:UDP-3-O-[3-hydroxymyristoyl] glucosamine N-acyltransferase